MQHRTIISPSGVNAAGVLMETTAELAMSQTSAAAWRIVEGDHFMRKGPSGVFLRYA
jgi:lactate dehydrogenase-like 2-hydroxyacid dehydrogenase